MITVALPKGRILEEVIAYFAAAGMDHYASQLDGKSRSLYTVIDDVKFIYAKAVDVPVYVEGGAADIGFVGSDTITETAYDIMTVAQLPFGKCHFSLCGKPGIQQFRSVATSFRNIAFRYFKERKQDVSIVYLNGSVELAPVLGLTDGIIDIVQTGGTLRANGLIEYDQFMDIQACLIANRQTFYTKEGEIYPFLKGLGVLS